LPEKHAAATESKEKSEMEHKWHHKHMGHALTFTIHVLWLAHDSAGRA
jgi:hypothetical protein